MTVPPLAPSVVVAVLGAGTMGRGIAWVAAAAGPAVLLYDAVGAAVVEAFEETRRRLDREVEKGRLTPEEAAAMLHRIATVDDVAAIEEAGLVVEAIIEDLDVKVDVLRRVEAAVAPSCIIATNTSSLSVTAIAAGLERPGQVAGMHFFNPAPVMPLVEIVAGAGSSPEVLATLSATAVAWGKTPVTCASTPGFIVNRVARPFYGEALRLLQEGIADAPSVDAVVTGAGEFRMGPFRLMDLVGLDVNLAVSTSVYEQTYHDSRFAPNVVQRTLVDAGRLGRKAGIGFYDYATDAAEPAPHLHAAAPGPSPAAVGVSGDLGHASGLLSRLTAAGFDVAPASASLPGLVVGDALLWPTDGRTATEAAAAAGGGSGVVALDLARDWSTATCVSVASAAQADSAALTAVAGVLQAAGLEVVVAGDGPGLVLMRIVAQLASVAADAVVVGVAAPEAIDTAMRLGTNYPQGPLAWADELGAASVVAVLDNLRTFYGEDRYRASPLLRRAALTGTRIQSGGDG